MSRCNCLFVAMQVSCRCILGPTGATLPSINRSILPFSLPFLLLFLSKTTAEVPITSSFASPGSRTAPLSGIAGCSVISELVVGGKMSPINGKKLNRSLAMNTHSRTVHGTNLNMSQRTVKKSSLSDC